MSTKPRKGKADGRPYDGAPKFWRQNVQKSANCCNSCKCVRRARRWRSSSASGRPRTRMYLTCYEQSATMDYRAVIVYGSRASRAATARRLCPAYRPCSKVRTSCGNNMVQSLLVHMVPIPCDKAVTRPSAARTHHQHIPLGHIHDHGNTPPRTHLLRHVTFDSPE